MKKTSDFLYRLIKKLDKSEKRYFKLYASRIVQGNKNNYLLLFEAIVKQEQYDEDTLKAQFKKEKFAAYFPTAKTQLKNLILDSLHEQHSSKHFEERLKKQLHQVSILYQKGFYKEGEKILLKAKKSTYELLKPSLTLQALALEETLIAYTKASDEVAIQQVFNEKLRIIKVIENTTVYNKLMHLVYSFYFKNYHLRKPEEQQELDALMMHPLLQDVNSALNASAKLLYYNIHAMYEYMKGNVETSLDYGKFTLQLFESDAVLMRAEASTYFTALVNYLEDCNELKKYEELLNGLEKLKTMPFQSPFKALPGIEAGVFHHATILELNYYKAVGDYQHGWLMLDEVAEKIQFHKPYLAVQYRFLLYQLIAYFHFLKKDFHTALDWNNKILDEGKQDIMNNLVAFAHIFNLIIHFELDNNILLEHLLKTAQRFYRQKQPSSPLSQVEAFKVEGLLIRFFKKLINVTTTQEQNKLLRKLKTKLTPYTSDTYEQYPFQYFEFLEWLDAKIENRDFIEILKISKRQQILVAEHIGCL